MSENTIPNTGLQLNLNFENVLIFLSALSPIFITLYFILKSVVNLEPSGFIWFAIISGVLFFSYMIRGMLKIRKPSDYANINFCGIFRDPFELTIGRYTAPSFHMTFHSFTLSYLGWDVFSNPNKGGLVFWCLLLLIAAIDMAYRFKNLCEGGLSLVIGIILGTITGLLSSVAVSKATNFRFSIFGRKIDASKCSIENRKYQCKVKSN